jgi:AGCS family alanine or glycine:cation symporter
MAVITAFSASMGAFISPILTVSVFFFALASVCAWGFYATRCAEHLNFSKGFAIIFPFLYALCSFFGCFVSEGIVWTLADLSVSLMAIINVIAITLLFGKVRNITKKEYGIIIKKQGS